MAKEMFQNYEFLAVSNEEGAGTSNQYFIVQEDKTILLNKTTNSEEIQYVTQVEDIKGVFDGLQMPIYEMPQQYYVNINNAGNIIMPDQLVLTNEDTNVFTSGFLLQPVPENTNQQLEVTDVNMIEEPSNNLVLPIEAPPSNTVTDSPCTEIILNEEQCQTLESKGFVILDVNNKVYRLDALGLHDITNDKVLQQKYREESAESNNNKDIVVEPPKKEPEKIVILEDIKLRSGAEGKQKCETETATEVNTDVEMTNAKQNVPSKKDPPLKQTKPATVPSKKHKTYSTYLKKIIEGKKILRVSIKTDYKVKEIPSKIYLGKLSNGKKLFARIKGEKASTVLKHKHPLVKRMVVDLSKSRRQQDFIEHGAEIEAALEQACNVDVVSCGVDDISSAEALVSRLLEFQQLSDTIQGRNVILTKSKRQANEKIDSKNVITLKSIVTGRVGQFDDTLNSWHFIYVPHLLAELLKKDSEYDSYEMSTNGDPVRRERDEEKEVHCIVHIHISEIVHDDEFAQTIVTVTKRDIPLDPVLYEKIEIINEARHACSSCAARFTSEKALIRHQKETCTQGQNTADDDEEKLTIDTQKELLPRIMISTEGIKYSACPICEMKFTRTSNYRRHLLTHFGPSDVERQEGKVVVKKPQEILPKKEKFKCKMCPASYIHAPTLSRHILKTHIKA